MHHLIEEIGVREEILQITNNGILLLQMLTLLQIGSLISTDLSAANNASGSALLHETGFLGQWLYQHQDILPEQLEVSFIYLNGKRYIEVSFISGTTREARKSIVAVVTDLLREANEDVAGTEHSSISAQPSVRYTGFVHEQHQLSAVDSIHSGQQLADRGAASTLESMLLDHQLMRVAENLRHSTDEYMEGGLSRELVVDRKEGIASLLKLGIPDELARIIVDGFTIDTSLQELLRKNEPHAQYWSDSGWDFIVNSDRISFTNNDYDRDQIEVWKILAKIILRALASK